MTALSPQPTPPDRSAVRYGVSMVRRFGWFYEFLGLGATMRRLRFAEHSVERVETAAATGPVVYVLLQQSTLDHLALNTVLVRKDLPLSTWANSTPSFFWQPVVEAWKDVFSRMGARARQGRTPDPVRCGWLAEQLAAGNPVTIFLQRGAEPPTADADPLRAVLDAQALTDASIQLVPVICVWDRAPESEDRAVRTFLLGSREAPSELTKLIALYGPSEMPFVQVGEPLDLASFVERVPEVRRLDSLRTLLRRYLRRESKVVRGPTLLPRRALETLVVDAPALRRFADEEAARRNVPVQLVRREIRKEFHTISANFSWPVIRFLSFAMRPLWTRIFSGYDIRDEDLDRIRTAMREGTAVLVPCHKSHFDYLLLAWILYWDDLIVPHVVAGINLAIWPVHYLLRACGGFFIRRSFAGEPIHAAVFARYLRELLLHGYTVEFFIEGGRTRTGRLLPPKLGVLDMALDAAAAAPEGHEISLLPVAIAYEQVAEEGAYTSELGGQDKREESVAELVKARSVLTRRYGRVYVRVGEPIRCSEVLPTEAESDEASRARLQHVGDQIVHRIGVAMVVLPTALVAAALLSHHRQGITHDDLMARIVRFDAAMSRVGAQRSPALTRFDAAIAQALDRFLAQGHVKRLGGMANRVWSVVPGRRVPLDFQKNQILHFLALPSIVAHAIRPHALEAFTAEDLLDDTTLLLTLMRREFTFDPEDDARARLGDGLSALAAHGAIASEGDGWRVADPGRIGEMHALVRPLIEAYRLVAHAAAKATGPLQPKAWTKALQDDEETWVATGLITRPEALSSVPLKHAVAVFTEDGVLVREGDERTVDVEAATAVAARLSDLVGR